MTFTNHHIPGDSRVHRRAVHRDLVDKYMGAEKPYLIHGFNLQDLASKTGINVPTLSALINQEFGMNFNDFINQYRVAYFKTLLVQEEFHRWTLEALAYKAGFSSRTTFIRAFTKFAACSPSRYLRTLKLFSSSRMNDKTAQA